MKKKGTRNREVKKRKDTIPVKEGEVDSFLLRCLEADLEGLRCLLPNALLVREAVEGPAVAEREALTTAMRVWHSGTFYNHVCGVMNSL